MSESRVLVTRIMVGICHMQVCAVEDATDEEILATCNAENPSGTSNGWCNVVRKDSDEDDVFREQGPVPCEEMPGRKHFLVSC